MRDGETFRYAGARILPHAPIVGRACLGAPAAGVGACGQTLSGPPSRPLGNRGLGTRPPNSARDEASAPVA